MSYIGKIQRPQPKIPRDYQADGVTSLTKSLDPGRRVYCSLPTGCGKTVIAAATIAEMRKSGAGRVLFIAHRNVLVEQIADALDDHGLTPGVIQGKRDDYRANVIAGSLQTLSVDGRLGRILSVGPIDLLVIDESHHAVAENSSYRDLIIRLAATNPELRVLGLTATPLARTIKKTPLLTCCVFERTIGDMVSAGWIAPLVHRRVLASLELLGLRSVRNEAGEADYSPTELARQALRPDVIRAVVEGTRDQIGDRPTLVFGVNVEHSKQLAEAYHAAGVNAAAAWGGQKNQDEIVERWKQHDLQLVSNCNVFTEGFDFPEIAALVIARPCRSRTAYLQMLGRGLRKAEGKTDCLVFDLMAQRPDLRQVTLANIVPPWMLKPGNNTENSVLSFVDPRSRGRWAWKQIVAKSGREFIHAPAGMNRSVKIVQNNDGSGLYRVFAWIGVGGINPITRQAVANEPVIISLIFERRMGFRLDDAMTAASNFIENYGDRILANSRRWSTANDHPSEAQLGLFKKLAGELWQLGMSERAMKIIANTHRTVAGLSNVIDHFSAILQADHFLERIKQKRIGHVALEV